MLCHLKLHRNVCFSPFSTLRNCIPETIVTDYFEQEHFSLKALVASCVDRAESDNRTNLSIVFTRTDASIHSIPTHNVNRNLTLNDPVAAGRLCQLVHDNLDELLVENLTVLKSEAALSSAIESWAKNDTKIMILLVDMSTKDAFEKVNYTRMCVEQNVEGIDGKTFILLLHYPLSGRDGTSCYPALFLGDWEHFYLDGIGSQDQLLRIEDLIEAACKGGNSGKLVEQDEVTACIADSSMDLLKRVLPHVASQKLFYPGQLGDGENSFNIRMKVLQDVLKCPLGNVETAKILCHKFAKMWAEHGLLNSMQQATNGLLLGTTRLSLSMSIRTVLVETFDTFMTFMIMEMNSWRNLDILLDSSTDERVFELFGLILNEIPVMPFEELVLMTNCHSVQVPPIPDLRNIKSASVRFPFFRLISSFIDECIETAEKTVKQEQTSDTDSGLLEPGGAEIFQQTVKLIHEAAAGDLSSLETQSKAGRVRPVQTAIAFVEEEEEEGSHESSLYKRYLEHYVEWKWGCDSKTFIADRIEQELAGYDCGRNIVAIHVAATVKSKDLNAAASFHKHLAASTIPAAPNGGTSSIVSSEELFEKLLDYFEATVFTDQVPSHQWSTSFLFLRPSGSCNVGREARRYQNFKSASNTLLLLHPN